MGPEATILIDMLWELEIINSMRLPVPHGAYLLERDIQRVAANIIAGGFDA